MDLLQQFQSKHDKNKTIIAFQEPEHTDVTEAAVQKTEISEIASPDIPEAPPTPIIAAPTVPSVHKSLMYENTKTWNPAVGCDFTCVYCEATFKRIVAWSTKQRGENCSGCLTYRPHEHPERLSRIPNGDIIFAFGNGDIAFYHEEFVEKAINELRINLRQSKKNKTVYFQSKDPKCFFRYIDKLKPIADSVVLLTTLETNRDAGYADISKAPLPSIRYKDFLALEWKRKAVTIEPVLNFDLRDFVDWIRDISPEAVYLGFNSRPDAVKLPEPSPEKFWDFYDALSEFTEVKLKDTRGNRPKKASSDLDVPPRRLYMDAGREEIIEEILRLERKHIQEGLSYDRVRYLGDNTLSRRKEFLLDYLYSLCDHLESYQIGIHDLAERQAIREYEREVEQKLRQQKPDSVAEGVSSLSQNSKVENFPDRRFFTAERTERKYFDFLPE